MISILASDADQPVVREFFELFKTPWQFHKGDAPAKILLCNGRAVAETQTVLSAVLPTGNRQADISRVLPRCIYDAVLVIVFTSEPTAFDENSGISYESKTEPGFFKYDGVELPVYGRQLVEKNSQQIVFRRGLMNGRPFVRVGFDLFAEIRHLLTAGQPIENAAVPALEQHVAFVRELILSHALPLVEIPPRPVGHEFITCLTHDVDHAGIRNHKFDHTMFGFLYRATAGSVLDVCAGRKNISQLGQNIFAALRLPLVHLGLARDFWYQFDHYTALEAGRPSTFYVIPKKGETGLDSLGQRMPRRAASYDAADLRDILQRLEMTGKEVTVHGLDAWRDAAAGREERGRIGGLVNHDTAGVRMHWLYFDAAAPEKLEAAGFLYDSTSGYNSTVGYRAGTVQVFKPLTTERLLELPMHIMDTALFYPSYLNLSPKQADAVVQQLIENACRFGGVLTVNWHDRSLAPERLWGNFYEQLLGHLQGKKAWFATAAQAVAWFRWRRAATFENAGTDKVKIKLPAIADDRLPPLRVRVYHPNKTTSPVSEQTVYDGWEMPFSISGRHPHPHRHAHPRPRPTRRKPFSTHVVTNSALKFS